MADANAAPHELTADECRYVFLKHLADVVRYWLNNSGPTTTLEKINGVVFSILAALDGTAHGLPTFDVYPSPHESDAESAREDGANWWPTDVALPMLHEHWHKFEPKE